MPREHFLAGSEEQAPLPMEGGTPPLFLTLCGFPTHLLCTHFYVGILSLPRGKISSARGMGL